jgi:hypothetical protein
MKAIVVTDQAAGTAGVKLVERPEPQGSALANLSGANYGDVVVQVHAPRGRSARTRFRDEAKRGTASVKAPRRPASTISAVVPE